MTGGLGFGLRHGAPHPGHPVLAWAIALVFVGVAVAVPILAVIVERRRCQAASLARVKRRIDGLLPADPKEDQNDGDPIRAAHEVWLVCSRCGCRHAAMERCPPPANAALRRAEDVRAIQKTFRASDGSEVALRDKPSSAPRSDRRSDPEDGRANARGRPACEPSRSITQCNGEMQAGFHAAERPS